MMPLFALGAINVPELSAQGKKINVKLQAKLFKDKVAGNGLEGVGVIKKDKIDGDDNKYPQENVIALAAFYTRFARSGNSECDQWATDAVFPSISAMGSDMLERIEDEKDYYTLDQAIALEFLSLGYSRSQNQEMLNLMENLYKSLIDFESSDSEINGYDDAYWRAINKIGDKIGGSGYEYCYTNITLMAIAGMLKFGMTVKGMTIDNDEQYYTTSITIAKDAIEFCEDKCFFNGSGFMEYPYADMVSPETKNYYARTQIIAALAYTRLYEATKEIGYLDKAEMMVKYIITKNFLDTGKTGGVVTYLSTATGIKSSTKLGYDNALYAYVLISLYNAIGDKGIGHLKRAEEIAVFMHDNLFYESGDGEIVGYIELLVDNDIPDGYKRIYFNTNALMMIVNEEIAFSERPWFIKYLWWIIFGAIGVIAVIVIVVLVKRKKDIGRKLPKLVKGLVED